MPSDEKRTICKMCNKVVIKLVPLYDHDQKHEKTMCCVFCKRKIKKNQPIEKFKRSDRIYSEIEEELNRRAKKREVVVPK